MVMFDDVHIVAKSTVVSDDCKLMWLATSASHVHEEATERCPFLDGDQGTHQLAVRLL